MAASATVASATAATAAATTEVFRRGLAGVVGAFAVKRMLHFGGDFLIEQALDASQQSAILGAAE